MFSTRSGVEDGQYLYVQAIPHRMLYLYQANQKAQRYSSSGDKTQGNAALTAMQQADKNLIELAAELEVIAGGDNREQTVKDKAAQITKDRTITENKTKSLKELDKLIEHVILNKMNK